MTDARITRLAGALSLVAAVLLLGLGFASPDGGAAPSPSSSPSYAALRPLLAEGAAKGLDDGLIDVFQFGRLDPSAWIWIRTHPSTGEREVWEVHHLTYVQPAPGQEIPTEYVYGEGPPAASLAALLAWIVDHYAHVLGPHELTAVPG